LEDFKGAIGGCGTFPSAPFPRDPRSLAHYEAKQDARQLKTSRSALGRTPLQEINRLRLERIKTLLKQEELPLAGPEKNAASEEASEAAMDPNDLLAELSCRCVRCG
jgi:hypothetical protein